MNEKEYRKIVDNPKVFILLLLFFLDKNKIEGITKLQKIYFIFLKEFRKKSEIIQEEKFYSYNFGPYSKELQIALTTLIEFGKINKKMKKENEERKSDHKFIDPDLIGPFIKDDFYIDEKQKIDIKNMISNIESKYSFFKQDKENMKIFFNDWNKKKLAEILKYVYTNYEDFTGKSIIKDDVMKYEK